MHTCGLLNYYRMDFVGPEKSSKICVPTWVEKKMNDFWIGIKSFYVILDFPFGPQYSLDSIIRLLPHFSPKRKYFILKSVDKIAGRKKSYFIIHSRHIHIHIPHTPYEKLPIERHIFWKFGRFIFRVHTIQAWKTSIILFVCFMGYEYLMRTQYTSSHPFINLYFWDAVHIHLIIFSFGLWSLIPFDNA